MLERVQYYFREMRGFKYDEVNAVLASSRGTLADVEARLTALAEVRPTENFEPLAASFKRIHNILKQAEFRAGWQVAGAFARARRRSAIFTTRIKPCTREIQGAGYRAALEGIASLRPHVDRFFDKVLVNAKDAGSSDQPPDSACRFIDRIFHDRRFFGDRHLRRSEMKNYVYSFGNGAADGDGKMKDVLGGKGAGLAEMSRAGIPVPPGFTISTEVCNIYFEKGNQVPDEINQQILKALAKLESQIGKKLGDPENPLLVSVRSGAKFSMPGMMNTILNLGLNDETVEGLVKRSGGNPRFAYDSYRRFIQMFGEVALNIDMEKFDHIFDERKHKAKAKLDTDLTADDLKAIIDQYKKLVQKETKKPFPQDAREQLSMSRDAVFRSWWNPKAAYYRKMEKIPDEIGTAASVQAMVFGNMGDTSATGVGFTRDPATGEKVFYGEFLINAQGEDVVAGIRTPQPISELEKVMPRRLQATARDHRRSSSSIIATCRISSSPSKRTSCTCCKRATANAPVRRPCASRWIWCEEGMIDKKEAVLRVQPQQLDQLLHPVFDVRVAQDADAAGDRHRRVAGRGGGPRGVHGGRSGGDGQERSGDSGPQGNHAGRYSRHGRREGHSDRGRRQVEPRGGGGARHGPAVHRRRGRDHHQ